MGSVVRYPAHSVEERVSEHANLVKDGPFLPQADSHVAALRLERMAQSLDRARRIRDAGLDAFRQSEDTQRVLERELQIALQAVLDTGAHFLDNGDVPRSYARLFDRLVDAGVLPPELGERMHEVAELRNQLVFGYLESDAERLFARLAVIDAAQAFADHVRTELDRS